MSDLNSIIEADDLDNLKRQLAYTFLDAYGNFDGADILFEAIVRATKERIIKLLKEDEWHHIAFATRSPDDEPTKYHDGECLGCRLIELIKGEQQ